MALVRALVVGDVELRDPLVELLQLRRREALRLKPGASREAEARHRRIRPRGGGCPTLAGNLDKPTMLRIHVLVIF